MSSGGFFCPKCRAASLAIADCIDFEPDNRSDDITLQVVRCRGCGLAALAIYEESRRGSLDGEASSHTGYFVDPSVVGSIETAIKACPSPRDSACSCAAHRKYGGRDGHGRWDGPPSIGIDWSQSFPMTLAG